MSKKWIFSNPSQNLITRCHSSSKTRDHGKILENRIFLPLMGTKSFLFRIFFLLIRLSPKLNINYRWEWQKKRVVNEPSIFNRKKLLSLKVEFWPIFSLKMGQNSNFKLNNFFAIEDRRFVDHAFFFVIPICSLCESLVVIEQIGKKCETKYFWYS